MGLVTWSDSYFVMDTSAAMCRALIQVKSENTGVEQGVSLYLKQGLMVTCLPQGDDRGSRLKNYLGSKVERS